MSSGFLLINKPKHATSHDAVAYLRKATGIQKIGHSGTLDPLAEGLLVVAVGREATKDMSELSTLDKRYEAIITLGAESETYDAEGPITLFNENANHCSMQDIIKNAISFLGNTEQIPPMYSAKKIRGKKMYDLARKGNVVERKPVIIKIYGINILSYNWPHLKLSIHCSSGTYIRKIAHDLGKLLGVGGYISELKRTAIGPIPLSRAIHLSAISNHNFENSLVAIDELSLQKYVMPKTRVITFGTFDCLHPGHVNYFEQAKKFGDELYTIVARDKTVERIKNKTPMHKESYRLKKVQKVPIVQQALLGNIDDPYKVLSDIKPHVICLGYDQRSFTIGLEDALDRLKLNAKIVRLAPFCEDKYKSSLYKNANR